MVKEDIIVKTKRFPQVSSENQKGAILHLITSRPDLLRDLSLVKKKLRLLLNITKLSFWWICCNGSCLL